MFPLSSFRSERPSRFERAGSIDAIGKRGILFAILFLPFLAAAQITITNGVQKYGSLTSTTVNMTGRCELWVTNSATPLSGCTINLNSADAWLFLPGTKPSVVASTYLAQVRVSGATAVADSNVRVVQYGQWGAVVIPQPAAFQPLTVFSEPNFGGSSAQYSQWTYYTGSGTKQFSSFQLKRGYQAVFAQSVDGKNYSKCYVAQDGDLEIGVLPPALDKQVQFIYVTPWRWTAKKGIAGDPGIGLLNLLWWYNWNISSSSSRDLEYVAIRQNQSWPSLAQNWQSLGINTLLGYNEPDQANQANLSVSAAISSWGDLLGTGLRVGSPATSDGGPNTWLIPFVSQADAAGLRVDFVCTHYYQAHNPADASGAASQMYNFLLNIWNNTHRPIWITEWNNGANWTDNNPWPVPTYAQQQACVAAMQQMLESTPFVERYALYNWVEDPRSVVTNGVATPAGLTYSNQVSNLSYAQAMPDNGTRGLAQYVFATNAWDSSGYGNNGMAVGAPGYTMGHNSQAQAIVLDGANSYVQLPANIARAGAITVAAWVYWNGGANWQRIFDFGNDTSHYLFLTPSSGSSTLRFAINNGSGEQTVQSGALAAGSWQHVAVTLSGNTARLYLNGTQVASSTTFSSAPSDFSPIKNYLGKSQFSADPLFNGKLDEVVIADYAMTAAQISALATSVLPGTSPFVSGTWTNDADGNWSDTNNWANGVVANGGAGVLYGADFSTVNLTADRVVALDSNRSIGRLKFGDPAGVQNWTLAGGNILTLDAATPFIAVNQNTATISTAVGGTNGFTKSGAGTLVLTGTNSISGPINADTGNASANDGALRVSNSSALGTAGSIQVRNSGNGSSAVQLDGSGGSVSLAQMFSLNGRTTATAAVENLAGNNTLAGAVGVYGSGKYVIQADAGVLNLSGTVSVSDSNSDTITFQGNGAVSVNGTVADGGGTMSVNKSGGGTLAFGPGSSYSGATTVSQGTLALQASPVPLLHLTFNNPAGSGNGSIITNAGTGGAAMNGMIVGSGASIVAGGRYGNALSINGAGGAAATNIVLIKSRVMNTDASGSWTVAYWIKTTTAGAVVMYQGDGSWSGSGQTAFLLNANSGSTAGTHAGAVRWAGGFLTGTASLNNGAWHFVALVDNRGTETIYVDGNADAVTSSMALPLSSGANQVWIGGAPDTDAGAVKMNGLIDEVYMFNRALNQAEVRSLSNNNVVTNAPVNVLPVGTTLNIGAAGAFDLAGIPQAVAALGGGGLVTNSGAATTLTVSNTTGASLFSGDIADSSSGNAISFTKSGNGIAVLTGSNSYSGATTVSGGTLKLSPVADDSILHLTFNNAAGSGNGTVITNVGLGGAAFNGTIVGTGATIAGGGRFGNALSLNGSGANASNNIVIITNKVLNTDASGSWTVGFWIKTATAGAVIMYQGDGTWSSAGQTTFYLNNNGTTSGTHAGAVRWAGGWLTGSAVLNNNIWHFITLVDKGGTESIYVDGNIDAVTSTMGSPLAGGANQVWIGGSPDPGDGSVKMNGLIDEVYMFNRALTQAEVQALYNNNYLSTNGGNVLPAATQVSVAAGSTLDVGGVLQTIGSLTGIGLVTNTGAATTLAVSNNSGVTIFSGNIGDLGTASALSFVQAGSATTVLSGVNTYRGVTTINAGTVLVDGALTGLGSVTVAGGTLGGNGTISGPVTVNANLQPGDNGIGTLTVGNDMTLGATATTAMAIDKTAGTNDLLQVTGTLNYGGTLAIANLSAPLAGGDSFQLFNASASTGNFSSISGSPGAGLDWQFNPTTGVLSVYSIVSTDINASITNGQLVLSWPADHIGWHLQVQTNDRAGGLGTNWIDLPDTATTTSVTNAVDPTTGSVFYRLVYP